MELFRDGYTVCPGVVGQRLREAALHTVNLAAGRGISKEEAESHKNGLQWPELMAHRSIVALFRDSGAADVVAELVGGPGLHPVHAGQIALRFPGAMCVDEGGHVATPGWDLAWHIDGMPGALPHMKPGRLDTFTALVGVCLQDVTRDLQGNFIAYPGSHWLIQEHFRRQGTAEVEQRGEAALPKSLPLAEARQVHIRAGDVMVAHYNLAHSVAPNTSPHIRYMVYFRVHSRLRTVEEYSPLHLTDMWACWPAMLPYSDGFAPSPGLGLPTPEDEEVASLAAAGQPLMEAKDWAAAAPLFGRLSEMRPRCYLFRLQAGLAAAFQRPPDPAVRRRAQEHLEAAAALSPVDGAAPSTLAIVLCERGDVPAAQLVLETRLLADAPAYFAEASQVLLVTAVALVKQSLRRAKQPGKATQLLTRLAARYPFLADATGDAAASGDVAETSVGNLWARTMACLGQEPKTPAVWAEGRRLGGLLAERQPGEFWPQMILGICFAYDASLPAPEAAAGTAFAEAAAAIDPSSPLPAALLCRCCLRARQEGVRRHFDKVLEGGATSSNLNVEEHGWLLLDALRCAKSAYGIGGKAQFTAAVATFKARYPPLAGRADRVSAEAGCCIM